MIKLKKLMGEGEDKKASNKTLSNEARRHFLEIISTYGSFGPKLKNETDLVNIAETLGAITDAAHEFATKEAGNHFDEVTVKRNMTELTKLSSQFEKIAGEAKSLQSQMENLYEDMGHIISRYYGMSELSEEDVNKRLGIQTRELGEGVVNEAKFEVYHKSYTKAIETAREYAEKQGYEINNDDTFTKIGMGPKKPSEGKTNRFSIELSKDGKVQRKQLHIQVYGMKNGYELNCYLG